MIDHDKVFINCPFDDKFFPLLKAMLFCLIYMDFKPQLSETSDSGQARINKIQSLMKASKYSIHDLSRIEITSLTDLPRFNMPFECGIDFGLKLSGAENFNDKAFLILDKERYRYQRVMSDIAGSDIKAHNDEPEKIINNIRDWFKSMGINAPRHKEIWLAFNQFESTYESIIVAEGYNPRKIDSLTFSDIIEFMEGWIITFKTRG